MENFYDVLEKEEGKASVSLYIQHILNMKEKQIVDPIGKAKAEILYETPIWNSGDSDVARDLINGYNKLCGEDQRKVDMTIRDLFDHYKVEDIIKAEALNASDKEITELIGKVLNDYMEFRVSLDTVTPEDSEEIEKILEMSDEEYDAYQKAKDAELEAQFEEASKGDTEDISGDEESN